MSDKHSPLSYDDCRELMETKTFRLRPPDYKEKYPIWPGSVGLELEAHLFKAPTREIPERVDLHEDGFMEALAQFAEDRGWQVNRQTVGKGQLPLQIIIEGTDNLSFEPAGQLEISTRPYPCLNDSIDRLKAIQDELSILFQQQSVQNLQIGINPWYGSSELGLQIPKSRYQAMDAYFQDIGPYGRRMMRQTCTVQVNLDYGPTEQTMANRFLAAQFLAPITAAIFSYSSVMEGKPLEMDGFRTRIWQGTDPSRTGFPKLDRLRSERTKNACLETYLDFALDANVIYLARNNFKVLKGVSFREWLERPIDNLRPTLADFEEHLSLLFPEVRARGFLEVRSADCQAPAWQAVPAAFYCGILYDDESLQKVLETFEAASANPNHLWQQAVYGLRDPAILELAKSSMEIALEGFRKVPPCFRGADTTARLGAFAKRFVFQGKTPGGELRERWVANACGNHLVTIRALEEEWEALCH